jgi:hypothetical protein
MNILTIGTTGLERLECGAARLQHGGQLVKQRLQQLAPSEPEPEGLERVRDEGREGEGKLLLITVAHQLEASQVREMLQVLQRRNLLLVI